MAQNAACPDCTWTIHAVIGQVDFVPLVAPTPRWPQKPTPTERAGPICKCARCSCEFYVAQGQVHRLFVGHNPRPESQPPPGTRTYPNGSTTRSRFDDAGAPISPGIGDLAPPPD